MYEPHSIEIRPERIPKYVGFEVELAGISVSELADCIPCDSGFTAVRDDSIKIIEEHLCPSCRRAHKVVRERHGAELVSPRLRLEDLPRALDTFSHIADEAVSYGAHINVTTAVHVHVDRTLFSLVDLRRTLDVFVSVEDAAYKTFTGDLDEPRVLYVDLHNFARSMRRFLEVNLRHYGDSAFMKMADKYWAWNVSTHGHDGEPRTTIEYRLFNSTMDSVKLRDMISFALGCSYLGLTGTEVGPPCYFTAGTETDSDLVSAVQNITEIGRKLLEAANGKA